jgi:hypothetical protein
MAKDNLIPVVVASCVIALSSALLLCSCTVSQTSSESPGNPQTSSNDTTPKDGVNLHIGDGSLNVDTPVFKMNKAGKGDKLHVEIPNIKFESK